MCKTPDTPDMPDPVRPDPTVKKATKQKRGDREGLEANAAALYGTQSNQFAGAPAGAIGGKTAFGA